MKHTDGKWMVSNGDQIVAMPSQIKICNRVSGANFEEVEANAKLIAAAPDLLEALIILKKWVGKLDDWKGEDPPCELVDKAIEKAKGF